MNNQINFILAGCSWAPDHLLTTLLVPSFRVSRWSGAQLQPAGMKFSGSGFYQLKIKIKIKSQIKSQEFLKSDKASDFKNAILIALNKVQGQLHPCLMTSWSCRNKIFQ